MKIIVTAIALAFATPAIAQTAPAAQPQQDHSRHQQQPGQPAGHGQHHGQGMQHGQDMQHGCCADRNGNGQMDCCENMAAGDMSRCQEMHGPAAQQPGQQPGQQSPQNQHNH